MFTVDFCNSGARIPLDFHTKYMFPARFTHKIQFQVHVLDGLVSRSVQPGPNMTPQRTPSEQDTDCPMPVHVFALSRRTPRRPKKYPNLHVTACFCTFASIANAETTGTRTQCYCMFRHDSGASSVFCKGVPGPHDTACFRTFGGRRHVQNQSGETIQIRLHMHVSEHFHAQARFLWKSAGPHNPRAFTTILGTQWLRRELRKPAAAACLHMIPEQAACHVRCPRPPWHCMFDAL